MESIAKLASSTWTYNNANVRSLYKAVAQSLQLKGGIALDIGAGPNNLPALGLLDAGLGLVIKIDNGPMLCLHPSIPKVANYKAEASRLPFNNNCIDAVIFNQSVWFIAGERYPGDARWFGEAAKQDDDLARVFGEVQRVLKPSGWVLIKPGSIIAIGTRSLEGPLIDSSLRGSGFEIARTYSIIESLNQTEQTIPVFIIARKP